MATQTQLRRGTAAQNNSFTGAVGELSYDTENKSVRVHDGSTAGGIEVLTGNGDISAKTSDGAALTLETSDTTVTDGSVLGKIEFKAPNEASGTDAILVGAAIEAIAEGTFAADNNATELVFKTGATAAADAKMTLTSGGNLGIGGAPSSLLHLEDDTPIITLRDTSAYSAGTGPYIQFQGLDSGSTNRVFGQIYGLSNGSNSGDLAFYTRDSGSTAERMRLDSSGRLLVGKTSGTIGQTGTVIYGGSNEGLIESTRDGAHVMKLNRLSSDGDIAVFAKAGTTVGSIGTVSSSLYIASPSGDQTGLRFSNNVVHPCGTSGSPKDNAIDLGYASARFDDIFATNGSIQTSDRNEKQDIASLTSAEMLVAKRISALFKTFRWRDKVAGKGNDARTHTGIIAQDVQAAFTAESLDAGDYSLFISSTWWEYDVEVPAVEAVAEVTDEDGNVTTEAVEAQDAYTRTDIYDTEDEAPEGATSKTRMGIRYPELLSFVAAYNEQRFAAIETRLTALEG